MIKMKGNKNTYLIRLGKDDSTDISAVGGPTLDYEALRVLLQADNIVSPEKKGRRRRS
jgi:hypothetical protein